MSPAPRCAAWSLRGSDVWLPPFLTLFVASAFRLTPRLRRSRRSPPRQPVRGEGGRRNTSGADLGLSRVTRLRARTIRRARAGSRISLAPSNTLANWCSWSGRRTSIAVKIEAVSIDIFYRELTQPPGLLRERFNDSCAPRAQFLVRRVDVRRKYPMNSRFEWAASSAKENRDVIARDGPDIASWI
jgi:hypothetical protein